MENGIKRVVWLKGKLTIGILGRVESRSDWETIPQLLNKSKLNKNQTYTSKWPIKVINDSLTYWPAQPVVTDVGDSCINKDVGFLYQMCERATDNNAQAKTKRE